VLLMLLRSKVTSREHQDQRVATLQLAERANRIGVIRQGVVREHAARYDVCPHVSPPLLRKDVFGHERRDEHVRGIDELLIFRSTATLQMA
jgi:site-specific recombinase XerC